VNPILRVSGKVRLGAAMAVLYDRMFIAQSTLEAWVDSGNVEMREHMVVLKKAGRSYHLEPAVRFLSVVPQDAAPKLIGKVLTERRIGELGGELLGDSVLLGELAFEVQPGYIGTLNTGLPGHETGDEDAAAGQS
jgi:hypothetical protein